MKIIFGIFTLITILSCTNSGQQQSESTQLVSESIVCYNSVSFGDIYICLPEIDGMKECYLVPIVKKLADQFEYEGNSVLAFYLNDKTYKQVDKLDEITYDDYFKIYATNQLKGIKAGKKELNEMSNAIGGNWIKEKWSGLKSKIEKDHNYLSVGRPILIEDYSPHEDVKTFIMLTKYQMEDYEYVMVMSMNMLLVKNRLIWLAYYKDYDGEESINKTKAKNDYIVLKFMDDNK